MNGSFDRFLHRWYFPVMACVLAFLVIMLSCPAKAAEKQAARRLEQVKWDVLTSTLTAVVSEGRIDQDKGKYVPERIVDYEMHLETGEASLNGEIENFSTYEGQLVRQIVEFLVKYATDTVLWFDYTHKREEVPKLEVSR